MARNGLAPLPAQAMAQSRLHGQGARMEQRASTERRRGGSSEEDAILQAVIAASLEEAAGVPLEAVFAASHTVGAEGMRLMATEPTAPGNIERLRAMLGENVERAGLERLLIQTDGNIDLAVRALSLTC